MLCLSAIPCSAAGQESDPPAPLDSTTFAVFDSTGRATTLGELIQAALDAEVVFLGEAHNDLLGHRLQLEILRAIAEKADRPVLLSLEMFERDIQYVVDEYVAGQIREDHFLASARPWEYYEGDYRPLVEYARSNRIGVLAANTPRRYVNLVTREGPSALARLSPEAKRSLPPLPYAGPSARYRAELDSVMAEHGGATMDPLEQENGLWAQSLWDAGMAYTIADALLSWPEAIVVHVAGAFHVQNGTGIPEQLARYRPGARTLTVIVEPVVDITTFEPTLSGVGEFVILTDRAHSRPP